MFYACIKRVGDIIIGLIGLVVLIPVTLVIKLAYILTGDWHSIFYTQERIGYRGKTFKLYKYRSMKPNAELLLDELLAEPVYREQWEQYQKLDPDPRITKIGRLLREGSLDELPQFINVLAGQMSMVGPRPLIPGELQSHHGNSEKYQSVKPGLTGYWAMRVRSSNSSDYDERLKLEYFYIDNHSLSLDLRILGNTLVRVLKREGAK